MKQLELTVDFSATARFDEVSYESKITVRRAVAETLKHEGFLYPSQVSFTFCNNEYIRKINSEYRGKDTHTDVLSFPMYDFAAGDEPDSLFGEPIMLGDIVVSLDRCKEQAAELGNSFLRELAFLVIHSTLHLLGYDHERGKEDEEAQCAAQRNIIEIMTDKGYFGEV